MRSLSNRGQQPEFRNADYVDVAMRAQTLWLDYVAQHCLLIGSEFHGGTAVSSVRAKCITEKLVQRLVDLRFGPIRKVVLGYELDIE